MKLHSEVFHSPNSRLHLIFLHGLLGQGSMFRFLMAGPQSNLIKEKFNCHLPDLRNHGRSTWHDSMTYPLLAADLKSYLGQIDDNSVILVGHSMGGKTAITFACMYPHLVRGLISLDAPPVDRNNYPELNRSTEYMMQ